MLVHDDVNVPVCNSLKFDNCKDSTATESYKKYIYDEIVSLVEYMGALQRSKVIDRILKPLQRNQDIGIPKSDIDILRGHFKPTWALRLAFASATIAFPLYAASQAGAQVTPGCPPQIAASNGGVLQSYIDGTQLTCYYNDGVVQTVRVPNSNLLPTPTSSSQSHGFDWWPIIGLVGTAAILSMIGGGIVGGSGSSGGGSNCPPSGATATGSGYK